MKTTILTIAATAALLACGQSASAATVYNNADVANNFISTPGNWDNGLLITQQGEIQINANYDAAITHTDYDVIHSAGNLTMVGNGSFKLSSST